jgi:hypothetical protein
VNPINLAGGFAIGVLAGMVAFGLWLAWDAVRYEADEPRDVRWGV